MSFIEIYESKVERYWGVLLTKEQQVLTLEEAIKVIKSINADGIDNLKEAMAHTSCLNVFSAKKGGSEEDMCKNAQISNLFLVKDEDDYYECGCGSVYYYVLLPEGNKVVDFDYTVIVPSFESVQNGNPFILQQDIVLGVPIQVNEDYTLRYPAIRICANCLSVSHYEYSEQLGLGIKKGDK